MSTSRHHLTPTLQINEDDEKGKKLFSKMLRMLIFLNIIGGTDAGKMVAKAIMGVSWD